MLLAIRMIAVFVLQAKETGTDLALLEGIVNSEMLNQTISIDC